MGQFPHLPTAACVDNCDNPQVCREQYDATALERAARRLLAESPHALSHVMCKPAACAWAEVRAALA